MPPEAPPISVVYIEDDERLARLFTKYLESHGLRVTHTADPREGVQMVVKERPDVVLLDLMLPGIDGFEICRQVRSKVDTPIIMVTARGEESDRVLGLERGADDYVPKPFSSPELLARIRAHARRARGMIGPASSFVSVGLLSIDPAARTASWRDAPLNLTTYEFDLLKVFAERPHRVLTREQLMDLVKGASDEAFDRSIDVHISHLRKKLGDDPRGPRIIKTIRGVGYMFAADAT